MKPSFIHKTQHFLSLFLLAVSGVFAQEKPISGVYEIGIGVTDPLPQIQYWEQFGYRICNIGTLKTDQAQRLYGAQSAVQSVRMCHLEADHGLIRLMIWANPTNQGIGLTQSLRQLGSRWGASMTADAYTLANHAEDALKAKMPVGYAAPVWTQIYAVGKGRPFLDPAVGVREMMLIQPHARQVFFERFNYVIPNYGKINEVSFFKSSQVTHVGMIIKTNNAASLNFFSEVLGLLPQKTEVSTYEKSVGGKLISDLRPGETYYVHDYDDPRSSTNFMEARSGRLKIIRFEESSTVEDARTKTQPGSLGMNLYTLRVRDLEAYHAKLKAATGVTNLTDISANEFGENSLSFTDPFGYVWTLVKW